MRTYDISLSISSDMLVWPGDPQITLERIQDMDAGEPCNVTSLRMSVHSGTHVDAPSHFLGGEQPTVEQLELNILTGRVYVLHFPDDVDLITRPVLEEAKIPPRTRRLIFRTRNSKLLQSQEKQFRKDFVALSADGAQYLVDRSVKLVGIDYLSIASYNELTPVHEILLKFGVVVVEGLNLFEVSQGRYTLYCLPLKIAGSDGAPARAILVGV